MLKSLVRQPLTLKPAKLHMLSQAAVKTNTLRLLNPAVTVRYLHQTTLYRQDERKSQPPQPPKDSASNRSSSPLSPSSAPASNKPLSRKPIGGTPKLEKPTDFEFATWKATALLLVVGGALYYFFQKEKKKLHTQKEAESNRGYGKPLIGGDFELIDFNGNKFTQENLKGKDQFNIIYFGFTHCPDICPEELDQLTEWLDELDKRGIKNVQPIFITCDPSRDTPDVLKKYLSEFHPKLIGLTGTYEQIKHVCKVYRVYFSTPPNVKPGQDYLVDHSIFFYLMDPDGEFINALGRQYDGPAGANKIQEHIEAYQPKSERSKKKWYEL